MNDQRGDEGFSLIELLMVILILGILTAVVVFAVGTLSDEAQSTGCQADKKVLEVAVEAYFAQNATQTIPAADASGDGYEKSLVAAQFLRQISEFHDLDADGEISEVAPCTL